MYLLNELIILVEFMKSRNCTVEELQLTSPGGMYSGQTVQDLPIEEISSDRRNPILADVMAQLDYMEKRGSGLKRIYNEPQIRNL